MDPLSWDYLLSPTVTAKRPKLPPLTPVEEQSLIRQVLGYGMGSLQAVGNLLDLPGSSVRDALAGNNPFDQWLSPLSGDNRTSGRELLASYGVTAPNDPNAWELADVGGFAAEVALDPTTYLTLGGSALTKAGQAVKKAGLLDDVAKVATTKLGPAIGKREARAVTTIDDLLNPMFYPDADQATKVAKKLADAGLDVSDANVRAQKVGGSFGVGLPFAEPAAVGGSGKAGQAFLKGMDQAGDYLAGTLPGRLLRGVFDRTAGNTFNRNVQKVMPEAMREIDAAKYDRFMEEDQWIKELGPEADNVNAMSLSIEKSDELDAAILAGTKDDFFRSRGLEPLSDKAIEVAKAMRDRQNAVHAELQAMAGSQFAQDLASEQINYNSRFRTEALRPDVKDQYATNKLFGLKADSLKGRTAPRDVPTYVLNNVSLDPKVAGATRTLKRTDAAAEHILETQYDVAGPGGAKAVKTAWEKVNGVTVPGKQLRRRGNVWSTVEEATQEINRDFGTDYTPDVVAQYLKYALDRDAEIMKSTGVADAWNQFLDEVLPTGTVRAKFFRDFDRVISEGGDIASKKLEKYGIDTWVEKLRRDAEADTVRYGALWNGFDDPEMRLRDMLLTFRGGKTLLKAEKQMTRVPADKQWILDKVLTPNQSGFRAPDAVLDDIQTQRTMNPVTPEEELLAARFEKAREVAKWAAERPESYVKSGVPTYGNTAAEDYARSTAGLRVSKANVGAIHRMFANVAVPNQGPDMIPLRQALSDVGFAPLMDEAGAIIEDNAAEYSSRLLAELGKPGSVDDLYVPLRDVEAAKQTMTKMMMPETVSGIMKAYDGFIKGTKLGLTFAPAFHVRNFIGGVTQNVLSGLWRDPLSGTKSMSEFRRFMAGKPIKGIEESVPMFRGLTNDEANEQLRVLVNAANLYQNQLDETGAAVGGAGEVFGGATPLERRAARLPVGNQPLTLTGVAGQFATDAKEIGKAAMERRFPKELNPANMAGVGDRKTNDFILAKVQASVGNYVEGQVRGSAFLEQLKQGVDPRQAAQNINAAHVDYTKATDVERHMLKRLFPFYSFTRGITEHVAKELFERPGGRTAQAIRATNSARSDDSYVPSYISEGTAIPMAGMPEWLGGKDGRYIAGFGLMHEAPFEMMALQPTVSGTIQRTAQKVGSMLAPPIRGAVETVTGVNLHTGRPQRDMYQYPFSGDTEAGRFGNLVLGNSPLARQISTVRKALDDRKDLGTRAVNLLSGVQITDLSGGVERAKEFEARKAVEEMMRQSPRFRTFENLYVPKEMYGSLTPLEMDLLRLKDSQLKKARQAAKENSAK